MQAKIFNNIKRILLILAGSSLMAFTVKTFVHAGGIVPAGFTGSVLLIQEICLRFGNISVPFSLIYYTFNIIPAIISFRFIGKKFTLYSVFVVLLTGLLIDWMPSMFIEAIQIHDTLLAAVFGGLLYGSANSLILRSGTTAGGSDFLAIFFSEKYRKDTFGYLLIANCFILAIAGFLFSLDKALYSIIFQYVTTVTLRTLFTNYQQKTLIIITNLPDEVYTAINEITHHGATYFDGRGSYEKSHRVMLYSVVTANEVKKLIPAIKKIDPAAFINVLKTELLNGKFYLRPKD